MLNFKQQERLIAKVQRLEQVYAEYLVESRTALPVCVREGEELLPVEDGYRWGAPFEYRRFECELPPTEEDTFLECDNGATENLLFLDGVPFGMTDWVRGAREADVRRHRFVPLPAGRGGRLVAEGYASHPICGTQPYDKPHTFSLLRLEGEREFHGIYLVRLRGELRRFLGLLRFYNSLFCAASEDDPLYIKLCEGYDALFAVLPVMSTPTDSALAEANRILEKIVLPLSPRKDAPFVGLVGHSHLDTAWLWTVEETRHKALRTAANAVTLLKRYDGYRFFLSTVLYLDWIRRDSPALFREIGELIRAGKLEPNGATWVECDCNMTGSEAMVRQFVRGKRFLREQFGYESDTFWLPDTFGYSAALPQIMRGCGVKYFLTTKLSWNDTNAFPYDSFVWKGIDGSCVTVHFNTIQCDAEPDVLARRVKERREKHLVDSALVAYGFGDGGGGPSDDMVRMALFTERHDPFVRARHTTVSAFMQALGESKLPTYCGELYLELHRGTLSVHHDIKRNNRLLETALHSAEFLSVAAGRRDLKAETDDCYDTLMLNQFHDILPGTCIREVNERARRENGEAIARMNALCAGGEGEGVYCNTLGFEREEILPCSESKEGYPDFDGRFRPLARYAFPAFGTGKKIVREEGVTERDGVVTAPSYRAVLREGEIVSFIAGGRELAAEPFNSLRFAESAPLKWDNWDIDADYPLKEERVAFLSSEKIYEGQFGVRVRNRYRFGGSSLTIDMVFTAEGVKFECRLDYREEHGLLRVYFPTDLLAPTVKSQIQFGHIDRSVCRNSSEEQAKFEVCNHKWSDLSETNFGVALLNDCKYGFSCEGGRMGLTLAKSGTHPDPTAGLGVYEFTYALLPHEGGFSARKVVRPAERLNAPPVWTSLPVRSPVSGLTAEGVLCETVKFADRGEGIVLRLYECERSHAGTELLLSGDYTVSECDLMETPIKELGRGDRFALEFRPFEIKTLLLVG